MMSNPGFTKGIWSQSHRKQSDGMYITQVYDESGQSICDLNWHAVDEGNGVTSTDREANSALIAAAPEMYAELESLLCLEGIIDTSKIKAVLAKARGES
tara:strand:- start:201 stop:497 length:297 start_codon:yes stop_codon:yes gene_type:complete